MPKIEIIRKGVTPAARPVPTDTTAAVLPMTLNRIGKEVEDEDEAPMSVDSVNDAFAKFKPSVHLETTAGEGRVCRRLRFSQHERFRSRQHSKASRRVSAMIWRSEEQYRSSLSAQRSMVFAGSKESVVRSEPAAADHRGHQ